ncbi:hypothetical protein [Phenylobacterium sp.]|uniref:hypothetical protein n=1 Tax=Phenylobacterium sp. TaxID=1871053 RepID=UPI0025EA617B|nr:hypothetical protein [Phenylobacterium sp.]
MGVLGAIGSFFRRLGADLVRESGEWRIRCDACGRERSLRSAGGIRWKAYGVKHTVGFCRACGVMRPATIYHPTKSPA